MTYVPGQSRTCSSCGLEKALVDFNGADETCRKCGSMRSYAASSAEARSSMADSGSVSDPTADDVTQLIGWGTALENEIAEAFVDCKGDVVRTATAMGTSPSVIRARLKELQRGAARRGWSPDTDMTKPVPEGFHVKGVSTYYDADGQVRGQWVKSQIDPEHKLERLFEAVKSIAEPFRGKSETIAPPTAVDDDLLCVYPMGDPHIGMFSWEAETGANFDLEIAERELVAAVDDLVKRAPPAKQALILNLGDFFHADNPNNQTARSGHTLDVDSRWAKVLRTGVRIMRRVVDRALDKHEFVRVVCEIGNHDDNSSVMLALCLDAYYENQPRVEIDTSPAKFHWLEFGHNLIGVTHGNGIKRDQLPGIMAADQHEAWGRTRHRYWYCGHVHHEAVKEYPGVVVESFRTLAPRDAWHAAAGYRSGQDMRCDVMHRQWGRVERHFVDISRVRAIAGGE